MKKLMLTLLLVSIGVSCYCQNIIQVDNIILDESECLTKEIILKDPTAIVITAQTFAATDKTIIVGLKLNSRQRSDAENGYRLKNLQNNRLLTGKLDSLFIFDLGKPFEEVPSVKDILYQLVHTEGKKCSKFVFKLSRGTDEVVLPNSAKLEIPELVLSVKVPLGDLCESCSPDSNVVQYNFSNNKLRTIWPKNDKYLYKRFTGRLPRVGREFTFQVINVNPFRYDITIANETLSHNTEAPEFLTAAFTPQIGLKAIAAGPEEEKMKNALDQLNAQLQSVMKQIRNAGDCFDPCPLVKDINRQIIEYFTKYFQYSSNESLESFFIRELDLNRKVTEKEKEEIEKLKKIVELYAAFRITGTSTVNYLIPQVQNVDQYLFKLNITPQKGITTGSRVLNQEILVDVLGGFKIDVSSGLFLTKLIDSKYTLRGDSTILIKTNGGDSVVNRRNKVIEDTGNKMDFGVSSMFHFYPRMTKSINLGFSLGAGATLNDKPKVRYLTGFSLLLGRTNRIALTGGWAMGYVDQLSNRYDDQTDATGNIYTAKSETSVQLKKVFQTKGFFSLTYNIPLQKKKTEVIASTPQSDQAKNEKDKDKKIE